jgi:hypothetical protein
MARTTKATQIGLDDGGYDATEIPARVWVEFAATGDRPAHEAYCLVVGQGLKFPKIVTPDGGQIEFARKTIIEAVRYGRNLKA